MDTGEGVSRASTTRSRPNTTPIGPRTPARQDSQFLRSSSIPANFSPPPSAFSTTFSGSSESRPLPTLREDLQEAQEPIPQCPDTLPPAYSPDPEPAVPGPSRSPSPPPRIPPPPKVTFESEQVEWKALPLEAALWTLSSIELQQIVSRAIRSSASESFIRLLTMENVDQVLPAELQRLEQLKFSMQAKYRFLVQRRTMVLQALMTNAQPSSSKDKEKEDIMGGVTKLAMQLSETTSECDRLLEELLKISDRTTQINRMLDTHWASALAIAIRKLNNSYARRTAELQRVKDRTTQLEAELEDAWNEAEKLAKEMDDYEADLEANDEAVIETAEVVSLPITPTSPRPQTGKLLNVEPVIPRSPLSPRYSEPKADIPADVNGQEDNQDSVSIRSAKSTRSVKSTKSAASLRSARGEYTHSMSVSAARMRSLRTSHGSLRLPHHSRKQSNSRPKTPADAQPPVPDIPLHFASQPFDSSAANASSVLLPGDQPNPSPHILQQTFTDESRSSTPLSRTRANLDDIILNDNLIEEVPRSPKWKNASLDDIRLIHESDPRASSNGLSPNNHSPSIWKNVDTPKTPAERVESLMRHANHKATPYQKIKTLTKRYSLPFPLLASAKSVAARRSSDRS